MRAMGYIAALIHVVAATIALCSKDWLLFGANLTTVLWIFNYLMESRDK